MTLVATLVLMLAVMLAMAAGVLAGRRPLTGSCGGLGGRQAKAESEDGSPVCGLCGSPVADDCRLPSRAPRTTPEADSPGLAVPVAERRR